MKTIKIIYWTTTIIFFLFDGVMPALTSHTKMAVDSIRHLGYPDYFRVMLTVFKVTGALVLILPQIKGRFKEWAYAGFAITLIAATVSHLAVEGLTSILIVPVFAFAVLATSYITYHKLNIAN
jgi:hypothetical protein